MPGLAAGSGKTKARNEGDLEFGLWEGLGHFKKYVPEVTLQRSADVVIKRWLNMWKAQTGSSSGSAEGVTVTSSSAPSSSGAEQDEPPAKKPRISAGEVPAVPKSAPSSSSSARGVPAVPKSAPSSSGARKGDPAAKKPRTIALEPYWS